MNDYYWVYHVIDEVIEIFNEDVFDDVRIGDKEKGLRTLEDTENLSVLLHPFYIFFTFGLFPNSPQVADVGQRFRTGNSLLGEDVKGRSAISIQFQQAGA